jgi:hypothetical protein
LVVSYGKYHDVPPAINPTSWSISLGFDQAELIEGHQRLLVCSAQDAMDADGTPQHPRDMAARP